MNIADAVVVTNDPNYIPSKEFEIPYVLAPNSTAAHCSVVHEAICTTWTRFKSIDRNTLFCGSNFPVDISVFDGRLLSGLRFHMGAKDRIGILDNYLNPVCLNYKGQIIMYSAYVWSFGLNLFNTEFKQATLNTLNHFGVRF